MREKLFCILENDNDSLLSRCYNLIMLVAIVISLIPLMSNYTNSFSFVNGLYFDCYFLLGLSF